MEADDARRAALSNIKHVRPAFDEGVPIRDREMPCAGPRSAVARRPAGATGTGGLVAARRMIGSRSQGRISLLSRYTDAEQAPPDEIVP
jgi:hypothetical protein